MKWIVRLIMVLVLLGAVTFGLGYLIPAHHVLSRSVTLKQPPDRIFALLADLPNMPTWAHGVKTVRMLPPIDGKEASRQTMDGNMIMTVITSESSPPHRLVRTIGDDDAPFSGSWAYDISPTANGSEVRLTEDATVPNPIFRLMVRISGPAKYLDQYLRDLAKHFGESADPR